MMVRELTSLIGAMITRVAALIVDEQRAEDWPAPEYVADG